MKKILSYVFLSFYFIELSLWSAFAISPFSWNTIIHYDAQDINADGDISTWEPSNWSQLGDWQEAINSFTGSQGALSSQPIYTSGAINNNLPGILFDGTNDILETRDETEINLDEIFSAKSFALVIETSANITDLQTIYEQWTHLKWYGFQISGWRLYGWVWNTIDWVAPNQYKIIDYGPISPNTSYNITLVHDNNTVSWYLDGTLISTLTGASSQTIHGICRFDTFFWCSLYGTGSTIGIGATQNDTLNLSNNSAINLYQWNYFSGSIWEILSWDIALSPTQVWEVETYFSRWNGDITAPSIDSINFASGSLLPWWNHNIIINYSDSESGIDVSSVNASLHKWDGISAWWWDISTGNLSINSTWTWSASYTTDDLDFWKYQLRFTVDDTSGNTGGQNIDFYIDDPEFIVSTWSVDIGNIDSFSSYYSDELEITVKTVGAGHNIFLNRNTDLSYLTETISPFTTLGYWYDLGPVYSNNISSFSDPVNIWTQASSININGNKNTYVYRIKIWALIDIQQAAGDYEWLIDLSILFDY